MAGLYELASRIEADRAAVEELGGGFGASKERAEQAVAAIGGLGAEGAATRMRSVSDKIEEAESIRAALQGALVKAHFQVMSAIHGRIGPGAPGSGAIVPLKMVDERTGAPKAGLDAIPPHLRQDPTPTGEELTGVDPSLSAFQKEHENANADFDKPKIRRLGRGFVRNTSELAGTAKEAAGKTTFKIGDHFDPWGPNAHAITETPTGQPPVYVSRLEPDINVGDVLSTTIAVAAMTFEALSRLARKKKDHG